MQTIELTNTERDDINEALKRQALHCEASIKAFAPCTSSNDIDIKNRRMDQLERINNLLQGKFLAI